MRRGLDPKAGDANVFPHDRFDRPRRHPHPGAAWRQVGFPLHANEERLPAILPRLEVAGQRLGRGIAEEDDARLAALPDDAELASLQVDVVAIEGWPLGEPPPGAA